MMGDIELKRTHTGGFWVGVRGAIVSENSILLVYPDIKPPQPLPNTAHPIPAHLPEEKVKLQSSGHQ